MTNPVACHNVTVNVNWPELKFPRMKGNKQNKILNTQNLTVSQIQAYSSNFPNADLSVVHL